MTDCFGFLDGKPGAYGIVFPDLPGSTAMDGTVEEARINATEAVADWVLERGGPEVSPQPSSLDAVAGSAKGRRAIAEEASLATAPLLIESGRLVRANISMDQVNLAAIDAAAAERGVTRSAFLAGAAIEKIRAESIS